MADHNEALRQIYPQLFAPLTFHVLGFLLLSFTFGTKYLSTRFILDRAARYLIPFWWVVTASSVLFSVLYLSKESLPEFFIRWSLAVMIGNAPFVKSSSGLMMLWFMPCLFGLSCLLACYDSLESNSVRYSAIGLAILAHLAIPLMPHTPMLWLPFGLAIAMDIFILDSSGEDCSEWPSRNGGGLFHFRPSSPRMPFLCHVPLHLEIATLSLAGISSPAYSVLQDVSGMAGFLSVIWLSSMLRHAGWLESIGKQSLLVYLLHPFVYILLNKLWRTGSNAESSLLMLLVNQSDHTLSCRWPCLPHGDYCGEVECAFGLVYAQIIESMASNEAIRPYLPFKVIVMLMRLIQRIGLAVFSLSISFAAVASPDMGSVGANELSERLMLNDGKRGVSCSHFLEMLFHGVVEEAIGAMLPEKCLAMSPSQWQDLKGQQRSGMFLRWFVAGYPPAIKKASSFFVLYRAKVTHVFTAARQLQSPIGQCWFWSYPMGGGSC